MSEPRWWRALPRSVRAALLVVAAVGIWALLGAAVAAWVATVAAFVFLALGSSLIQSKAPELVERALSDAPLNAVVGSDSAVMSEGWSVALPIELLESDYPPPGIQHLEARAQLVALRGYDVGESQIRVALEGRSIDTVTIVGMRASVEHSEPPISDTLVTSPSAGEGRVIALTFDLDKDNPRAVAEDGSDPFGSGYITLRRGEVQIFQLTGVTRTRACAWRLEVAFNHRGNEGAMIIPTADEPFRTTPRAPTYARSYHWAWYEQPARIIPAPRLEA
jgi:hypothetical protein